MKFRTLYIVPLVVLCFLLPANTHAQVLPPPDTTDTPIDGGVSILIGAGVAYGIKKVKSHRKKQRDENEPSPSNI